MQHNDETLGTWEETFQQIEQVLKDNSGGGPHTIMSITLYYNEQYVVITTNGDAVRDWLIKMDIYGNPFLVQDFGHWTF